MISLIFRMAVALGREGHMPQIIGMVHPDTMSPNFSLFLMVSLMLQIAGLWQKVNLNRAFQSTLLSIKKSK